MSAIPSTVHNDSTYTPPPATDTLQPGETLDQFAARHQVTPGAVRAANPDLFAEIDQTRQAVAADESQLLQNETLVVPEPAMSVGGDPLTSDFNPGYGTSNNEYGVDVDAGNASGGVTWNPGDGMIEVRNGQVYSTENTGAAEGAGGTSPVNFEVRQDTAVATGTRNEGGNTIVTVEVDVGSSVTGSADAGRVEGEASVGSGFRGRFEVTLPGDNQNPAAALNVNPFDPTTIPVGGSVTMHGAAYTSSEIAGSFRNIGTRTSVTEATGASYTVARPTEDTIQVTMGPDYAIEAFNGVGLRFDNAELMVGRADNLGATTLQTAEFDLSTPAGQAAYANFVATGDVALGAGTSKVATIERIDYSSQARIEAELGPLSASIGGPENIGSMVRTTYPDGSYAVTTGLQYADNAPLTITQRFDAAGTEVLSERTYAFEVDGDRPSYNAIERFFGADEGGEEANIAANLNIALTGNPDGNGPAQAGGTTTITFTETQLQALMEQTRSAGEATHPSNPLNLLVGGNDGQPVATSMDFAIAMARNIGGDPYGFAQRLLDVSMWADGDPRNGYDRIDAEVEVQ